MTTKTKTQSYWCNTGKHQKLYDKLRPLLVKPQGRSGTFHGEVLRATGAIYYDQFNNNACNFDLPHFKRDRELLWKMRTFLPKEVRAALKSFVLMRPYRDLMTAEQQEAFDAVVDAVLLWVDEQRRLFAPRLV